MSWILKLSGTSPPLYLRDYRHGASGHWTADERCAEPFIRAIDALEMARRLSHLRGERIEAVSLTTGEDLLPADQGEQDHLARLSEAASAIETEAAWQAAVIEAFDLDEESDSKISNIQREPHWTDYHKAISNCTFTDCKVVNAETDTSLKLIAVRDPDDSGHVRIGFGHKF